MPSVLLIFPRKPKIKGNAVLVNLKINKPPANTPIFKRVPITSELSATIASTLGDTPPDAEPVGTARASLPHDRTLLFHRSFLDTQMLPFTYPRLDTSTVSTTDYPSAVMYRLFIQKDFSTRFQFLSIVDCLGQSRDAYLH